MFPVCASWEQEVSILLLLYHLPRQKHSLWFSKEGKDIFYCSRPARACTKQLLQSRKPAYSDHYCTIPSDLNLYAVCLHRLNKYSMIQRTDRDSSPIAGGLCPHSNTRSCCAGSLHELQLAIDLRWYTCQISKDINNKMTHTILGDSLG